MPSRDSISHCIVGIAGGTGSGKTTLARRLAERYAVPGAVLVDQDSYYRSQAHLSTVERTMVNYDAPSAFDHDLLFQHFQRLLEGQAVEKPCYSFASHTRTSRVEEICPAALVILEGLFAFWDPRLRALMDLKIFVNAASDIRLIRRLHRDLEERGRTVESILRQYTESVRPMHQRYVEPLKAHADLVLDTTERPLEESLAEIDRALAKMRGSFRGSTGA